MGESGTNNAKVGGKDQRASRQQKTGRFACKFCRLINKDIIPADGILLYSKQLDNKELNSVTKWDWDGEQLGQTDKLNSKTKIKH